jgi:release factor glutamine methyltransferase
VVFVSAAFSGDNAPGIVKELPRPMPTLAETLQAAIADLRPHSESPRLDAEILLSAALGKTRSYLIAWPEQAVPALALERFEGWLAQRATGVPVAYLTGRKEFWSLELEITPQVLAPRPETELLVERALEWLPVGAPCRVLDLGTGSGAIALAIASERPLALVIATDRSEGALEVAQGNAGRLGLANVSFRLGDWYQAIAGEARFDLIVSNPPYIAENDPAMRTAELSAEPRMALTPGPSGLEAIECIAQGALSFLLPGGWLAVEHGADQGEGVHTLFTRHSLNEVTTLKDLAGRDRVTYGRTPVSAAADYRGQLRQV